MAWKSQWLATRSWAASTSASRTRSPASSRRTCWTVSSRGPSSWQESAADRRIRDAAEEEDRPGRIVADGEEERVVDGHLDDVRRHSRRADHDGGCRGGLRPCLIDGDVCLVNDIANREPLIGGD